jgi:hypothetical protein
LFGVVDPAVVEVLIRSWAEYATRLPDTDRAAIEREVYPRIRNATTVYQLADIRRTAEHEWVARSAVPQGSSSSS